MNVVFPIPFGPMIPMISPAVTCPALTASWKVPSFFLISGHASFVSGEYSASGEV